MSKDNKRNAAQRIEDLERALMAMYQTADNMARDLMTVKEAVKLLGNKLNAVQTSTGVTDEQVAALMVAANVAELKEKVDTLVGQGILAAAEEVGPNSFIVGKEINDAGEVVNPRLQFSLTAIQPDLKTKILGAKLGQTLDLEAGKLKLEVCEIYNIQNPEPASEEQISEETSSEETSTETAAQA